MQIGEKLFIKARGSQKNGTTGGSFPPYPYWDQGRKCEVVGIYPNFIVVKCLPHHNPFQMCEGLTEPYTVTIDRFDIGRRFEVKTA